MEMIEDPQCFALDGLPHHQDIISALLDGTVPIGHPKLARKAALYELCHALNAKFINGDTIPMTDLDEALVLEAMDSGLIVGQIGKTLNLVYARPPTRQPWLKKRIEVLSKSLISLSK